ncbi:MAG: hypothetical protein LC808_28005, partial [Actinobacteria bacterium]|nr:hypothetical protein [Actinomycetota bacterium]
QECPQLAVAASSVIRMAPSGPVWTAATCDGFRDRRMFVALKRAEFVAMQRPKERWEARPQPPAPPSQPRRTCIYLIPSSPSRRR